MLTIVNVIHKSPLLKATSLFVCGLIKFFKEFDLFKVGDDERNATECSGQTDEID